MSAQHTPGPWRYEEGTKTIRSMPANYWLASMDSWDGAINNAANAARIVACVNACEGWDDPGNMRRIVDRDLPCLPGIAAERDALRAEVERLREVLTVVDKYLDPAYDGGDPSAYELRADVRAALGGQA